MLDENTNVKAPNEQEQTKREKIKSLLIRTGIFAACGVALAVLIFLLMGGFAATETEDTLKTVCDALFVTAALFLCAAGILFAAGQGVFYGIGHGFKSIFSRKDESYQHYIERKNKEQGDSHSVPKLLPFVFSGGLYLIAALVIVIIYSSL